MELVRTVAEVRRVTAAWRRKGARIGLVSAQGRLHRGHQALIGRAHDDCDRTVLTVFKVPSEIGDVLDQPPDPPARDTDIGLGDGKAPSLVFAPGAAELFPPGFDLHLRADHLTTLLCGAQRSDWFAMRMLMALKLINISTADTMFVGEIDWQLVRVLQRMVRDADLPCRIAPVGTVRDDDGLAVARRNERLSGQERAVAAHLPAALHEAAARIGAGTPTELACAEAQEALFMAGFSRVDYVECRDEARLRLAPAPAIGGRVFGAAWVGDTRLIDNARVPPPGLSPASACVRPDMPRTRPASAPRPASPPPRHNGASCRCGSRDWRLRRYGPRRSCRWPSERPRSPASRH